MEAEWEDLEEVWGVNVQSEFNEQVEHAEVGVGTSDETKLCVAEFGTQTQPNVDREVRSFFPGTHRHATPSASALFSTSERFLCSVRSCRFRPMRLGPKVKSKRRRIPAF